MMTSTPTPPQERLLNLVIGLAAATRPVTRAQIQQDFVGYSDSKSDSAFERLFERDKEILRRLGIPLITAPLSTFDDEVGYLIDASNYALPPLELSPAQARVATLAATLWRDSAMQDAAARGVTKLRATGASMAGLTPPALDINPGATTPGFSDFVDAISGRRLVEFTYRAASSGAESKRRVHPWRITGRRGAWYVRGWDLDREAARMFRLDRIQGKVRARGPEGAFEIPAASEFSEADAGAVPIARVVVAAGRANALRLRADRVVPLDQSAAQELGLAPAQRWEGADVLELPVHDVGELSRTIAGLGAQCLVLGPAVLRERVIGLLRGISEVV